MLENDKEEQLKIDIGEDIRKCRIKAGLTQEQLGEKVNLTYKSISAVENGQKQLKSCKLILIAKELSMSLDDLYLKPSYLDQPDWNFSGSYTSYLDNPTVLKSNPDKQVNYHVHLTKSDKMKRELMQMIERADKQKLELIYQICLSLNQYDDGKGRL